MGGEGKKSTRGATKMTTLTRLSHRNRLPIQFEELGNSIGPNKVPFTSYVGMLIQTIMCVFKFLIN